MCDNFNPPKSNAKKPYVKTIYLEWLFVSKKHKSSFWKKLGNYDMIVLSRSNLVYNFPQIFSALFFEVFRIVLSALPMICSTSLFLT